MKILGIILLVVIFTVLGIGVWIHNSKKTIDVNSMKFSTMDDILLNLDDMTGDKYTILNFWATWCKPCIEEMPLLEALYVELDTSVWQLYLVSDERKETITGFIARRNFALKFLKLENNRETYGINILPRTIVLDRQGTIVYDKLGAFSMTDEKQLKKRLTQILK